jgi:hypothetical protein
MKVLSSNLLLPSIVCKQKKKGKKRKKKKGMKERKKERKEKGSIE